MPDNDNPAKKPMKANEQCGFLLNLAGDYVEEGKINMAIDALNMARERCQFGIEIMKSDRTMSTIMGPLIETMMSLIDYSIGQITSDMVQPESE